jgi:hypothetical protein
LNSESPLAPPSFVNYYSSVFQGHLQSDKVRNMYNQEHCELIYSAFIFSLQHLLWFGSEPALDLIMSSGVHLNPLCADSNTKYLQI